MTESITVDFVSDISCPWCVLGLLALEQAVQELGDSVTVQIRIQPFELNPDMVAGGQDTTEHLTQKYGSTAQQLAEVRATLAQRGQALGFEFHAGGRGRVYNTFDAHRLLYWVGQTAPEQQPALKKALMLACHSHNRVMDAQEVLLAAVASVGLEVAPARAVLDSDRYTQEVRSAEAFYQRQGIHSVPAFIVNQRHLISGAQPSTVLTQALRQIATQPG